MPTNDTRSPLGDVFAGEGSVAVHAHTSVPPEPVWCQCVNGLSCDFCEQFSMGPAAVLIDSVRHDQNECWPFQARKGSACSAHATVSHFPAAQPFRAPDCTIWPRNSSHSCVLFAFISFSIASLRDLSYGDSTASNNGVQTRSDFIQAQHLHIFKYTSFALINNACIILYINSMKPMTDSTS